MTNSHLLEYIQRQATTANDEVVLPGDMRLREVFLSKGIDPTRLRCVGRPPRAAGQCARGSAARGRVCCAQRQQP